MGISTFHHLFRNSFMEANILGGTVFLKVISKPYFHSFTHRMCKYYLFPHAILKIVDAKICLYLQSMKYIETITEKLE